MNTSNKLNSGRFTQKTLFVSMLLTGSLISQVVVAQESSTDTEDGPNLLEVVYVTATKRDARVLDVPMAVSALGGKGLIERNLLQIEDFAGQVPGLVVQQVGNRAARIILRGLNSGGAGATVASVIDEATLSYSSSLSNGAIDIANLDTYDLNRIEVLRGPQGTLYGAAAEGGLIKYVTNAPVLDQFEGDGEVGIDKITHGQAGFNTRAMVNIPLAEGKAALRITGFYKDIPGYIDNTLTGRKNANDGDRFGGRIQLLLQPQENLSIRFMAMMQDQTYNDSGDVEVIGAALTPGVRNPNEFKIANGGDLQYNTPTSSDSDNQLRLYYALVNWSLPSVDFISSTSYGEVNSTFHNNVTYTEAAPGFTYEQAFSGAYGGVPINIFLDQVNDLAKFNQEFRFSSVENIDVGSMGIDWQFGAFYSDEDIVFDQFGVIADPITGEVLLTDIYASLGVPQLPGGGSELPASYQEISGFGDMVLHFTEQFEMSLGGRYSSNKQESQVTNYAGLLNGPFDIFNPKIKSDESKFTWSVAPSFHISEDNMVYGRIATGYRPGGPSLAVPGAPADFPLSYESDSTINYEIGTKGIIEGGRFSYDLAAFYIDWTDIQVLSSFVSESSGQTFTVTGNAGKAVSKGFEWSLSWELFDGLVLSDNGAFVDAKLTESNQLLGGVKGDQLPLVPEWTNTLNVDYSTNIGSAAVTFGADWRYTGERYTGFGGSTVPTEERRPGTHVRLPSYSTFNAHVLANFNKYRVRLYVQNLTDERALIGYSTGGGYQLTGSAQIIQPRTYGVSFGVSF